MASVRDRKVACKKKAPARRFWRYASRGVLAGRGGKGGWGLRPTADERAPYGSVPPVSKKISCGSAAGRRRGLRVVGWVEPRNARRNPSMGFASAQPILPTKNGGGAHGPHETHHGGDRQCGAGDGGVEPACVRGLGAHPAVSRPRGRGARSKLYQIPAVQRGRGAALGRHRLEPTGA